MKTLVTGANGFLGGYLVAELLKRGHQVVGLDNFSKYGRVEKSYDGQSAYRLVEGDASRQVGQGAWPIQGAVAEVAPVAEPGRAGL